MDDEDGTPLAVSGDESRAMMGDLWSWVCDDMGGSGPNVKLSETSSRTVVTSAHVEEGETIFSIPIECLMHPAVAFDDRQYGAALAALSLEDGVDDRTILVFFLAIERSRGKLSNWAPYVNSLPTDVPSPVGWSDAELLHLAGTRLEGAVKNQREALRQQTEVCVPLLLARLQKQLELLDAPSGAAAQERAAAADILAAAERALTPARVAWSRSCVWSRAFSLYINGTKTTALVPLGDMLDHFSGARVEWRTDDAAGTFSIVSHQSIPAGGAVYNNYGAKSNEELLLGYGFVLEPNQADTLHVQLAANETMDRGDSGEARDREPAAREALLRQCELCSNFFLRLDDPLPAALLDAARMYLLSPAAAYMCNSVNEGVWDPHNAIDVSSDLCASFRVLQALTRLLTTDFERLSSSLDPVSDSPSRGGSVRSCVVRMTTVYRNSQLRIAAAALEVLRERSRHLLSKLEIAEQRRVATNNETFGFFARNAMETKENEGFELAYHTWETEIGVQKVAAEELSVFEGTNVLGAGVGGLRVTSPVLEGGVLGSAPMEALIIADVDILLNSGKTTVNTGEQAALAATLLMHAEQHSANRWGPFARWLLSAPTTAAAFNKDVLDMLENTPLGQEALGTRQAYDDEFAALTATEVLMHWKNNTAMNDSYARARAVVERHAFRLPYQRQTSQPPVAGRLTLAPFVGSLPRKLDDVAGTFYWAYRPDVIGTCESGWCLELKAACRLGPGSLLITPLEGSDEETRLLEVGSGAASSPPVSPRLLMQNDGKTKFPSVSTSSVSAMRRGESTSISLTSNPWHAVEILLEPADEDSELRRRKKDLLYDAGLGEAHYLTLPPSPARLCVALAVCGAESLSTIEVIRAALSETSGARSTGTPSVAVNRCGTGGPTAGSTENIHLPGLVEDGSLAFSKPSLSFPTTTRQRQEDHFNLELVGDGPPAISTCFTLKVMTSNAGMYKRARKAARTLLRRMLGLLPKGADTESLWEHARDETKRGNQQRAGAFVYLAQHRATVEICLEALTPAVDYSSAGGKKRRREREGGGGGGGVFL
jgi:hypothetical protein